MKKSKLTFLAAALAIGLGVSGCSGMNNQQQRAVSGGAIGAAGGAALGLVTGYNPVVMGVLGAAGGAAVGALCK